jgi:hypothetical protein
VQITPAAAYISPNVLYGLANRLAGVVPRQHMDDDVSAAMLLHVAKWLP